MRTAIPVNLSVDQGADLFVEFNLRDESSNYINLLGYTVTAKFSRSYQSVTPTYAFDAQVPVDNAAEGLVTLSLSGTTEDTVNNIPKTGDLKAGRYLYDVYLTSPAGDVDKYLEGILTVSPGVL